MADAPSPPWNLRCPWCLYFIVVNARGAHGADSGSGVEAARVMKDHVGRYHGKTWPEFLAVSPDP